jgi:SNF2 family DNA or RNA helicase
MKTFADLDAATGFNVKAGFNLTPKQVEAAEYIASFERTANFSEVGTGKTVMSTASSMLANPGTTLVLVPPVLIPQWVRWLSKFSKDVLRYQGTPAFRKAQDLRRRWVVMSHSIFRQDFNRIHDVLVHANLEIIVDEAQALKNIESVLYRSVLKLGVGQRIQLLTGTPTSKPLDAYSYIKIKTPKLYKSYYAFESLVVADRDFFGKVTKYANLDRVAQELALQTVKFTKEELFGFKLDPIFPDCQYDLDAAHLKLYERLVDEQLLLLDDGTKIDATTSVRLFHALQQVVCNWAHFSGDETKRSAIYDLVDQTIEETECLTPGKSKLIIWTYYKLTTRSMVKYLRDKGYKTVAAYGEVDSQKSFDAFMQDPDTRILVAQPQSAGAGLNPQSVCWEMLFVETPTVPMLARQAIGRVVRMGQEHIPRIKVASASMTIQARLLAQLMSNDDLVAKVERTRDSIRSWLKGR